MTNRSIVFLLCPTAIASFAALLYPAERLRESHTLLGEIRDSFKESVAETHALHRTLRHQRGAINDIHRYLFPVSKGSL